MQPRSGRPTPVRSTSTAFVKKAPGNGGNGRRARAASRNSARSWIAARSRAASAWALRASASLAIASMQAGYGDRRLFAIGGRPPAARVRATADRPQPMASVLGVGEVRLPFARRRRAGREAARSDLADGGEQAVDVALTVEGGEAGAQALVVDHARDDAVEPPERGTGLVRVGAIDFERDDAAADALVQRRRDAHTADALQALDGAGCEGQAVALDRVPVAGERLIERLLQAGEHDAAVRRQLELVDGVVGRLEVALIIVLTAGAVDDGQRAQPFDEVAADVEHRRAVGPEQPLMAGHRQDVADERAAGVRPLADRRDR